MEFGPVSCAAKQWRTARSRRRPPPSLGVWLILRAREIEGSQFATGGIDGEDCGKALKWDLEPPGIIDLRHEAHISEAHVGAEGIRGGPDPRLDRLEARI